MNAFVWWLAAASVAFPLAACGDDDAAGLAGLYRVSDVREVAAELELRANGRFDYGLIYGGADESASGTWLVSAGKVRLLADKAAAPSLSWGKALPDFEGDYGKDVDKPVVLVVKVVSPQLGMTWSNMEVSAEFSNGQTRSGLTANNGMLGFLARDEPEWRGATVRRISVAYPKAKVAPQWFAIDAPSTKMAIVHFAPGEMIPSAFERLDLLIERDGAAGVVLLATAGGQGPQWRFRRDR